MEHPSVTAARGKVERCRGHWERVLERADVSRSWLSKFARGEITNPTIDTLQAVSDACDEVIASLPSQQAA